MAKKRHAITLTVVANEEGACPLCGSYWGHPDPALDFPNRSKVGDSDGNWWWRCYNPACEVGYWVPGRPDLGYDAKLTPEAEAAMHARVKAEVDAMCEGKHWAETSPGCFQLVPDEEGQ